MFGFKFENLQTEVYDRVSREAAIRRERAAITIAALLPQMRTGEDLEKLEQQGYALRSDFGTLDPRSLESHRARLSFVNRALAREGGSFLAFNFGKMPTNEIQSACVDSSRLALALILQPPKGIEVCTRNPKAELPQLARLLVRSKLYNQPVPFVVPCCPDTNQYRLGDGLGDVIPKGLDYCEAVRDLSASHDFCTSFDVQVADVEGLDPVILANSGETTESHFAKTSETIRKAQAEVSERGHGDFITVRSMLTAFTERGMQYGEAQAVAVKRIAASQDRKVQKTVDGLLAERVRLGNFDHFGAQTRRELVIAELAGYAAYGAMVGAQAVILSPDAKSAIPAYHYSLDTPEQYSPVFYAR